MTWTSHIDRDANCIVTIHHSFPDGQAFADFLGFLTGHPEFRPGINLLSDLRSVVLPGEVDFEWILRNAPDLSEFYERLGRCKDAIVFRDMVGYGFGNQIRHFLENSPADHRPFVEMREAKLWLGLPVSYRLDLVPNEVPETSS